MGKLLIGWGEASLVPDKKVSLRGQFFERISTHVESEITATALAIEADGSAAIIVSADLTSIPAYLMRTCREQLAKLLPEFDPRNLIIAATHTHTSHTTADPFLDEKVGFAGARSILAEFMPADKEYKALVTADDSVMKPLDATWFVTRQIVSAAVGAWEHRTAGYIANEFGRAAVGMCRRVSYDDGTAAMWGDTNTANFVAMEGGNDSGVELLYTFDEKKRLTGVVANIACPSQVLEQRSFISADFWGSAKEFLRAKLGDHIYLLGLGGAGGDQCPRDLIRWVEPETPIDDPNVSRPNPIKRKADPSMYDLAGCKRIGRRIANEILTVLEDVTELHDMLPFTHKVIDLDLPLRKATRAEYEQAVREIEYYVDKNKDKKNFTFADTAKMHVFCGTIQRFREQQFTEIYTIETHVIRLGDVAIATNPFELFLDFGNRMKARSLAQQTFVVQLACGADGYLPTEKAEKAGHYSAYISSGHVGHEGGDLLVRTTLNEIEKMWK